MKHVFAVVESLVSEAETLTEDEGKALLAVAARVKEALALDTAETAKHFNTLTNELRYTRIELEQAQTYRTIVREGS